MLTENQHVTLRRIADALETIAVGLKYQNVLFEKQNEFHEAAKERVDKNENLD